MRTEYALALPTGERIGSVGVRALPGGSSALIHRLWVHPDYRGLGLSRRLLGNVTADADREGVILESNPWGLQDVDDEKQDRALYSGNGNVPTAPRSAIEALHASFGFAPVESGEGFHRWVRSGRGATIPTQLPKDDAKLAAISVFFHGTNHLFGPGDMVEPGYPSNYGFDPESHVYFTNDEANAHQWAQDAAEMPHDEDWQEDPKVYEVEPTGEYEQDPKAETKLDFRSRHPLRVVRRVAAAHRYVLPEDYHPDLNEDERQAQYFHDVGDYDSPYEAYSYTGIDPAWGEHGPHPGYSDEEALNIIKRSGPFYHGSDTPGLTSIDWRNGKANSSTGMSGWRNFFTNDKEFAKRFYGRYIYQVEPSNWEDVEPDPYGGMMGSAGTGHPSMGHAAEAADNGGHLSMQAYHPLNVLSVEDTGHQREAAANADDADDEEEHEPTADLNINIDPEAVQSMEEINRHLEREREQLERERVQNEHDYYGDDWKEVGARKGRAPQADRDWLMKGEGKGLGWHQDSDLDETYAREGKNGELHVMTWLPKKKVWSGETISPSGASAGELEHPSALETHHALERNWTNYLGNRKTFNPDPEPETYPEGTVFLEPHELGLNLPREEPKSGYGEFHADPYGTGFMKTNAMEHDEEYPLSPTEEPNSYDRAGFHAAGWEFTGKDQPEDWDDEEPLEWSYKKVHKEPGRYGLESHAEFLNVGENDGKPVNKWVMSTFHPSNPHEMTSETMWEKPGNAGEMADSYAHSQADRLGYHRPQDSSTPKYTEESAAWSWPNHEQPGGTYYPRNRGSLNNLLRVLQEGYSSSGSIPKGETDDDLFDPHRALGWGDSGWLNTEPMMRRLNAVGSYSQDPDYLNSLEFVHENDPGQRGAHRLLAIGPDDKAHGAVSWWKEDSGWTPGEVSHIYVTEEHRGKGLPEELLRRAKKINKDNGWSPLTHDPEPEPDGERMIRNLGDVPGGPVLQHEARERPTWANRMQEPNKFSEFGSVKVPGLLPDHTIHYSGDGQGAACGTHTPEGSSNNVTHVTCNKCRFTRAYKMAPSPRNPNGKTWDEVEREDRLSRRRMGSADGLTVEDYEGREGNNEHITRNERGDIPIDWIRNMPGARGEVPGQHRNAQGPEWEDFKAHVAAGDPGYSSPVFIVVEHGKEPRLSEGNHRRDAHVELGSTHVPAEIRYFGHAERQGTVGERAMRRTAAATPRDFTGGHDQTKPHPNLFYAKRQGLGPGCSGPCTYGGTHCAICHEPVAYNLHAAFQYDHQGDGHPVGAGWHHADGLRRDHETVPADPQGVIDSIPGQIAKKDQVRRQVSDLLDSQFRSIDPSYRPRPRGDEGEMPLDPFLAKAAAASADESNLKAAGIAVIAMDTGRVLMQQRALNPLMCPCGMGVTWDDQNGYQHDDGSVSHDGEFYGQSVSDLLDQGHPEGDTGEYDEEAPETGIDKTGALEFDPNEGTWEFPGGKLDPGENARQAAVREFREEVGQDLPPGVFVGAWVSPGALIVTAAGFGHRPPRNAPEALTPIEDESPRDAMDRLGQVDTSDWSHGYRKALYRLYQQHSINLPSEDPRWGEEHPQLRANRAAIEPDTRSRYEKSRAGLVEPLIERVRKGYDIGPHSTRVGAVDEWWRVSNAADPVLDGADPRAMQGDMQYGIDGVCPVPGRGGPQVDYAQGMPDPNMTPRVAAGLPGHRDESDEARRRLEIRRDQQAAEDATKAERVRRQTPPQEHVDQFLAAGWKPRAEGAPDYHPNFTRTSPATGLEYWLSYAKDSDPGEHTWMLDARVPQGDGTSRRFNDRHPDRIWQGSGEFIANSPEGIHNRVRDMEKDWLFGTGQDEEGREREEGFLKDLRRRQFDEYEDSSPEDTPFGYGWKTIPNHPVNPRDPEVWPERLPVAPGNESERLNSGNPIPGAFPGFGLHYEDYPEQKSPGIERAGAVASVYKGFIYLIQNERDIDLSNREHANPDDPDGDMTEQSAWWDIDHAKENPALREECKKGTPWDELELWADKSVRNNREVIAMVQKLAAQPADDQIHRRRIKNTPGAPVGQYVDYGGTLYYPKESPWWSTKRREVLDAKDVADKEYFGSLMRRAIGVNAARVIRSPKKTDPPHTVYSEVHPYSRSHNINPDSTETNAGILAGLGDMLQVEGDRRDNNWKSLPNDEPYVYDFAYSDPANFEDKLGPGQNQWGHVYSDFAHHFMDDYVAHRYGRLGENPLSPGVDVPRITNALQSLRPEYERAGRGDWHDELMNRWNQIAQHAAGDDRAPVLGNKVLPHEAAAQKLAMPLPPWGSDKPTSHGYPTDDGRGQSSQPELLSHGGGQWVRHRPDPRLTTNSEPTLRLSPEEQAHGRYLISVLGRHVFDANVPEVLPPDTLGPKDEPGTVYSRYVPGLEGVGHPFSTFDPDVTEPGGFRAPSGGMKGAKNIALLHHVANVKDQIQNNNYDKRVLPNGETELWNHDHTIHGLRERGQEARENLPVDAAHMSQLAGHYLPFDEEWDDEADEPTGYLYLDRDNIGGGVYSHRDAHRFMQRLDSPFVKGEFAKLGRQDWLAGVRRATEHMNQNASAANVPDITKPDGVQAHYANVGDKDDNLYNTIDWSRPETVRESRPTDQLVHHVGEVWPVRVTGDVGGEKRIVLGDSTQIHPLVEAESPRSRWPLRLCSDHLMDLKRDVADGFLGDRASNIEVTNDHWPIGTGLQIDQRKQYPGTHDLCDVCRNTGMKSYVPDEWMKQAAHPEAGLIDRAWYRLQHPTDKAGRELAGIQDEDAARKADLKRVVDAYGLDPNTGHHELGEHIRFVATLGREGTPAGKMGRPATGSPEDFYAKIVKSHAEGKGGRIGKMSMPLTPHEPQVNDTLRYGDERDVNEVGNPLYSGSRVEDVSLPSGDWIRKYPEYRHMHDPVYDVDPDNMAYFKEGAQRQADMEEFASRFAHAISDPDEHPLAPEAISAQKESDRTPAAYIRKIYDISPVWQDPHADEYVNTPRGKQMGYYHSVLGEGDHRDHRNMATTTSWLDPSKKVIVSHDHALASLPLYAEALRDKDPHGSRIMKWQHEFGLSPYESHFMITNAAGWPDRKRTNPLGPEDTSRVMAASETMRPWAQSRGLGSWLDAAQRRIKLLGAGATGKQTMFPYQMPHEREAALEHTASAKPEWWKVVVAAG